MNTIIGTDVIIQIGLVVHDLEATGQKFAVFFVECPPTCYSGDADVVKGVYQGEATKATCHMKFFETSSLQIELIQPDDTPSVWRDFLNENGEGLNHIAFGVKKMDDAFEVMEKKGYPLLQRGFYGDASGQFAYMDTRSDLKLILELLEDFEQKN